MSVRRDLMEVDGGRRGGGRFERQSRRLQMRTWCFLCQQQEQDWGELEGVVGGCARGKRWQHEDRHEPGLNNFTKRLTCVYFEYKCHIKSPRGTLQWAGLSANTTTTGVSVPRLPNRTDHEWLRLSLGAWIENRKADARTVTTVSSPVLKFNRHPPPGFTLSGHSTLQREEEMRLKTWRYRKDGVESTSTWSQWLQHTDCSGSGRRRRLEQALVAILVLLVFAAELLLQHPQLLGDRRLQRRVQFHHFGKVGPGLLLVPHGSVRLRPLVVGLDVVWEGKETRGRKWRVYRQVDTTSDGSQIVAGSSHSSRLPPLPPLPPPTQYLYWTSGRWYQWYRPALSWEASDPDLHERANFNTASAK